MALANRFPVSSLRDLEALVTQTCRDALDERVGRVVL